MKSRIIKSTAIAAAAAILACTACRNPESKDSRPTATNVISLAGKWQCTLDPNNVGIERRWQDRRFQQEISLPGSLPQNGCGFDVSADTKWTGGIIDRSWFTDPKFEKYRNAPNAKVPFWLTPLKHYVGPAWYQKQIQIPTNFDRKRIVLFLERPHWQTQVWIDGAHAGTAESLSTPHKYDLTKLLAPGPHLLTIRVDNSMIYDVGENAHSVSDHTQSNFNGIVGRIELRATPKIYIENIQVYPDIENKIAEARITIVNAAAPADVTLTVGARGREELPPKSAELTASEGPTTIDIDYPMGTDPALWDEFSPETYTLHAILEARTPATALEDHRSAEFGMRTFTAKETQFQINGRPTFLRGTLECCIFPKTGYPPTDTAEWTRILEVAKAHGLNHIRFHSWCPPEAAFVAADALGIYFHVECPAWTTIGDGKPIDKFIYDESDRILDEYGNHPSFCMLAYGNEPGGKNQKRWLGDLVKYWKQKDPRRLYTSAAGWPIIPESDYHSTPAPRGHQWGAGLKSRFNAAPPETATDYAAFIKNYDAPVVSHEIGQWCVYPNFDEIEKYTGVLKPGNFEIFRDSLAANHMLDQAHDFLLASGKLQALLYKEEIESALRTPGFGGFQLLDLHDFPGQGTALVGILDPFWDSKGYVTADQHRRYCAETVPLLRMKKRIWTTAETFSADAQIAHFGPEPLQKAVAHWSLTGRTGKVLASGDLPPIDIPIANGIALGKIECPLADIQAPAQLLLTLAIKDTKYANDWKIWLYPPKEDTAPPPDILIAQRLDAAALAALDAGRKVLLMPELNEIDTDVPPGFTSIFWNTAWTRRQPPHTLGILCDPGHPALEKFPTEFHSDWQWWDLVTKSRSVILDDFPPDLRPIVQPIDDWTTNRRLALIFEAAVSKGSLLLCSIDLRTDLPNRPVARQMLRSLLDYMQTDRFKPARRLDPETLKRIFRKPPLSTRLKSVTADSHHPDYPPANAIDGNPNTIWHTPWENNPPAYPHHITLEFPEPVEIMGLRYLPRQDMSNGWIAKYHVYTAGDPEDFSDLAAQGDWPRGTAPQRILFDKPRTARFIRLVALEGFDARIFAAIAELEIIPPAEN
ncbi:MAG: discoidin domain-containing protein [Sedimentisphaerales bacterium]|nr:discoidin domain-containing protein [Sedimentisphaerales bacterium]